jgi:hypothetical protein
MYTATCQNRKKMLTSTIVLNLNCELTSFFSLGDLKGLEYKKVRLSGTFDSSKEVLLGPRSLIGPKGGDPQSRGLISHGSGSAGYYVITPFKLSNQKYGLSHSFFRITPIIMYVFEWQKVDKSLVLEFRQYRLLDCSFRTSNVTYDPIVFMLSVSSLDLKILK